MKFYLFKKPKVFAGGKKGYRWYYTYTDPSTKKRPQKACIGCRTRREAEAYVRALSPESVMPERRALVRDIAKDMYIPGGAHIQRRAQLGRVLDIKTILESRRFVEKILSDWGGRPLEAINSPEVTTLLMQVPRGAVWKKKYRRVFIEIYDEARWQGFKIPKPEFDRFVVRCRKPDTFSTEELNRLFVPENFPSETFYLLFLLCLSAGLRIGEALGAQHRQILFDRRAFVIDGFCKEGGVRTNYNKTGSADNQRIRVTILPCFIVEQLSGFICRNNIGENDFLFVREDGRPISRAAAYTVFRRALVKIKIAGGPAKTKDKNTARKLCIHSLRYTYVTRMRRELPAETVMKAVGHMNVEMTDYYTNKRAVDESLAGLTGLDAAADKLFQ